jgi:hypothetical protein
MGLRRGWFQIHASRIHYDLTTPRAVKRAISAGATRVTAKFLLKNSWWAKK